MSVVPDLQPLPQVGESFSPCNIFQKPEERHRAAHNWRKRTNASWSAVAVLLYLFDRAARNCCCWPHLNIIARDLDLSENQTRRIITQIKTGAAVGVKGHGPLGNEYVLLWHESYTEALRPFVRTRKHHSNASQPAPTKPTLILSGLTAGETHHQDGGFSSRLPFNEKPSIDENPIQSTAVREESATGTDELIDVGKQFSIVERSDDTAPLLTAQGRHSSSAFRKQAPITAPRGRDFSDQESLQIADARSRFANWEWEAVEYAINTFGYVRPPHTPERTVVVDDLLITRVLNAGNGAAGNDIAEYLADRLAYVQRNPSRWPMAEGWFVSIIAERFKRYESRPDGQQLGNDLAADTLQAEDHEEASRLALQAEFARGFNSYVAKV